VRYPLPSTSKSDNGIGSGRALAPWCSPEWGLLGDEFFAQADASNCKPLYPGADSEMMLCKMEASLTPENLNLEGPAVKLEVCRPVP